MPMIDVTAVAGTFADKPALMRDLTAALMRWEKVPDLALFRDNTAAFVYELGPDALANANGAADRVRVQILTPEGTLDRDQKLGVVREMTEIVAAAAGDPGVKERTWVLITEAPDGGWGMAGHAYTRAEIAATAREQLGAHRA
jgi:phenylpyruvate tautomerase PptA (4-oxalocrotonate tautomerase family)